MQIYLQGHHFQLEQVCMQECRSESAADDHIQDVVLDIILARLRPNMSGVAQCKEEQINLTAEVESERDKDDNLHHLFL